MGDAPATTDARAGAASVPSGRVSLRTPVARLLTVVVGVLPILAALSYLLLQTTLPSDGTHLRPGGDAVRPEGLVLSPLGPAAGPLREGDVLVAIEGVDVARLVARRVGGEPLVGAGADGADASAVRVAHLGDAWRHGASLRYEVVRDGERRSVGVVLGRHPTHRAILRTWGTILFALVNLVVATLVFARRPDHPPARVLFVGAGALIGATTWSLGSSTSDLIHGGGFALYQLTTVPIFMMYWTSVLHFAAHFPRPLPLARRRVFAPLLYLAPIGVLAAFGVFWSRLADPLERLAALAPVPGAYAAGALALAMLATGRQYRRHPSGPARQQIRWVVLAAWLTGAAGLSLYIVPPLVGAAAVHPNFIGAIATVFPLAIAVAVLRHNLFDIDVLIRRTLVYGVLTIAVATVYVAVVTGFGLLFQARGGLLPALLATGLVAVAFGPVREAVQRSVNRLLYGERDDPASVLSRLGTRLEGALAPDEVLPALVETVAQALRLPYAAIALDAAAGRSTVATYGRAKNPPERFPLVYRGEGIGELVVEPRDATEAFTPGEIALLATIARQAGVSAYAVRTAADLRRSRERLVAAREEERRRLRRELHDGLGPALAGLTLRLDAASNVLERDAGAARAILQDLRGQVQGAVADLRGIVHALRPPALDDLGLIGAIREQTLRHAHGGSIVELEAPSALPPVPAAVEVAAYRIVQEALTNVVRHAGAGRCRVALRVEGALRIVIEDDGVGLDPALGRAAADAGSPHGLGIPSMRERAAELGGSLAVVRRPGGGTRVDARLPLEAAPRGAHERHGRETPPPGGACRDARRNA